MPGKILVVDDEPLILVTVERALSKLGYEILKARNLKELDEALKKGPFNLLITDLFMEEDSAENIIARVKQGSPAVRILRMSGSVNQLDSPDFIEKPFRLDELRDKVRDFLNEPQ